MMSEIFGGRGVWDAARIITVLLAAFSLASWGLELSMDLSELEGEADLLNRPPPVSLRPDTNDTWQVKLQLSCCDFLPYLFSSNGFGLCWVSSHRAILQYLASRRTVDKDMRTRPPPAAFFRWLARPLLLHLNRPKTSGHGTATTHNP